MKFISIVVISALAVLLGLFFKSDCDLPLYFFPNIDEKSAFNGKVVWITGASSGIGAGLAVDLSKAGAQVIITARRLSQLQSVADSCALVGKRPLIIPFDVTDYSMHMKATQQIIELFGKIDILVLNAGKSQRNTAIDTQFSDTKSLIDLNFLSLVSLTKAVLPHMLERKAGQLVVMSSVAGIMPVPVSSSYAATKHALHGFYNSLRTEVSEHNISVSIICPGPVESEIHLTTIKNPENPTQDEGDKMSTARCTSLVVKGLFYRFEEMWISEQPILALAYVNVYMPWISRQIMSKVAGPKRVKALKEGGKMNDVTELLTK